VTKKKVDKYEKWRASVREYLEREQAVWRFREQVKGLRSDKLFTADEVQALYDRALKVMTYEPGATVDDDLERATTDEIQDAEDLIFQARFAKEQAWIRKAQARAAQHIMNPKEH
jgi:hypothetical protein